MTTKVDFTAVAGGLRITRMVSTERTLAVPGSIEGTPVVSIGPSFLSGTPGAGSRTLVIPASVTEIDPCALEGTMGISTIEYGGELTIFEGFKLLNSDDCTLRCLHGGRSFEFGFIADTPMSFPEFDDAVLSLCMRLTPEIALKRLSDPVGLTKENRSRYERFVSDRIMPRAEQAISNSDRGSLKQLFDSGMVSDEDLRKLLERSLRSGRVGMTSAIMSEIRRRTIG